MKWIKVMMKRATKLSTIRMAKKKRRKRMKKMMKTMRITYPEKKHLI